MLKKIIPLTVFCIAMGLLETAVVVYLRIIYFPHDQDHPLLTPTPLILATELGRELATIIMLIAVGVLTGDNKAQRFGYFMYSFAVWDLFYYVFLKLLLNWPSHILDWDLLFLLPVPWIGPVLAPCIASLGMIGLALLIIKLEHDGYRVRLSRRFWVLLGSGFLIIILSFINYSLPLVVTYLHGEESNVIIRNLKQLMFQTYNWPLFACGLAFILASGMVVYKHRKLVPIAIER